MATPDGNDLLDALLAPDRWETGRCTVTQALAEIADDKARARVTAACLDPKVKPTNLIKAFKHLIDGSPADQTIRRHRAGNCGCP